MFTGLIEVIGQVIAIDAKEQGLRLILSSPWDDLQVGESISVNGVCLTLLPDTRPFELHFDISPETLKLTQLQDLKPNDPVNLERAMAVGKRFGGHYVSGHVDTTAILKSRTSLGEYTEIEVGDFSPLEKRFLLPKGSITLNGVSLTINAIRDAAIVVMLVPHTLSHTTFGKAIIGQKLNIEFDYIARIIAHQLGSQLESTIMSPFAKNIEVSE